MNKSEEFAMANELKELAYANVKIAENLEELVYAKDNYKEQFELLSQLICNTQEVNINHFEKYKAQSILSKDDILWAETQLKKVAENLGIEISIFENNKIKITIPKINLQTRNIDSQPFFLSTLSYELGKFSRTKEFNSWKVDHQKEKAHITFIHEYASKEKCCDNDNVECKRIIDTLQTYGFILSDRGDMLFHTHKGAITGKRKTTIIIENID